MTMLYLRGVGLTHVEVVGFNRGGKEIARKGKQLVTATREGERLSGIV